LSIDWRRGVVEVEPAERRGKIRWFGEARGLSFEICQGLKNVLAGASLERCGLRLRADERLEKLRDECSWVPPTGGTALVRGPDGTQHWWTFGGMAANTWLSTAVGDLGQQVSVSDLSIRLTDSATPSDLIERLARCEPSRLHLSEQIAAGAVERLKFG